MLERKTLTLTTFSRLEPAASRMADRFLMHWCWQLSQHPERNISEISSQHGERTYGVSLDVAVDQLASLSVHGDGAGDEDHAIGLDGLAVDARERLGSLVGENSNFGGHCEVVGLVKVDGGWWELERICRCELVKR
jgi:hypothetical protein